METITIRAAATAVMASFLFAAMGATIKIASHRLDNEMVVFLRNLIGLLLILPLIWRMGPALIRTHRPGMHLLRALTGLSAMYCFFYALAHLNLAEAMLLNYSAPLFIAVIAVLWLGEQVTLTLCIALLCGFAGIALILKPDTGIIAPAALIGSLAGLFAGIAMVSIRRMSDSEPAMRIVYLANEMKGPFGGMLVVLLLSAAVGIAIGLAVSAMSRTSEFAVTMLPMVILPMILLGGALQPVEKMNGS